MDSSRVFRLTRTSVHKLSDLSMYAPTSQFALYKAPDRPCSIDGSDQLMRNSRPMNRFNHHSLKCREGETRHHSLISLRTFYAFGARSASVSSCSPYRLSSSYSSQGRGSGLISSLVLPGLGSHLRRSSTSSFHNTCAHLSKCSHPRTFSQISSSYACRTPSSKLSSLTHVPHHATNHLKPTSSLRSYSYPRPNSRPVSPCSTVTRATATPFSKDKASLSDVEVKRTAVHTALSSPRDQTVDERKAANTRQAASQTPTISIASDTSTLKAELAPKELTELISLREQNKVLKVEVQKLTALVQENEQKEQQLRRRIQESEAEAKVWRKKHEMQKPPIIEIRENDRGIDLSADLIDQLDSAAEKLSRFNAVKDLKQLQSEMETALNEIREK